MSADVNVICKIIQTPLHDLYDLKVRLASAEWGMERDYLDVLTAYLTGDSSELSVLAETKDGTVLCSQGRLVRMMNFVRSSVASFCVLALFLGTVSVRLVHAQEAELAFSFFMSSEKESGSYNKYLVNIRSSALRKQDFYPREVRGIGAIYKLGDQAFVRTAGHIFATRGKIGSAKYLQNGKLFLPAAKYRDAIPRKVAMPTVETSDRFYYEELLEFFEENILTYNIDRDADDVLILLNLSEKRSPVGDSPNYNDMHKAFPEPNILAEYLVDLDRLLVKPEVADYLESWGVVYLDKAREHFYPQLEKSESRSRRHQFKMGLGIDPSAYSEVIPKNRIGDHFLIQHKVEKGQSGTPVIRKRLASAIKQKVPIEYVSGDGYFYEVIGHVISRTHFFDRSHVTSYSRKNASLFAHYLNPHPSVLPTDYFFLDEEVHPKVVTIFEHYPATPNIVLRKLKAHDEYYEPPEPISIMLNVQKWTTINRERERRDEDPVMIGGGEAIDGGELVRSMVSDISHPLRNLYSVGLEWHGNVYRRETGKEDDHANIFAALHTDQPTSSKDREELFGTFSVPATWTNLRFVRKKDGRHMVALIRDLSDFRRGSRIRHGYGVELHPDLFLELVDAKIAKSRQLESLIDLRGLFKQKNIACELKIGNEQRYFQNFKGWFAARDGEHEKYEGLKDGLSVSEFSRVLEGIPVQDRSLISEQFELKRVSPVEMSIFSRDFSHSILFAKDKFKESFYPYIELKSEQGFEVVIDLRGLYSTSAYDYAHHGIYPLSNGHLSSEFEILSAVPFVELKVYDPKTKKVIHSGAVLCSQQKGEKE